MRTNPGKGLDDGLSLFGLTSLKTPSAVKVAAELLRSSNPNRVPERLAKEADTKSVAVRFDDCARVLVESRDGGGRNLSPLPLQVDGEFQGESERAEFRFIPDCLHIVAPGRR